HPPPRVAARPTPFPYTTLFRSARAHHADISFVPAAIDIGPGHRLGRFHQSHRTLSAGSIHWGAIEATACVRVNWQDRILAGPARSEEHTSELQSRENLVCRLLL